MKKSDVFAVCMVLIGPFLGQSQIVQGRSFITGFETGSASEGFAYGGSVQSVVVRSGSYAYRAHPIASNNYISFTSRATGGVQRTIFRSSRFYMKVGQLPTAGSVSIVKIGGAATFNPEVDLNSDGTLTLADSWYPVIARSQMALSADGLWHRLEFDVGIGLGVYVDGALWAKGGSTSYPTAASISFGAGASPTYVNATADLYFDDILIDAGSFSSDGFPGDGHAVLVRPVLDPSNLNSWVNGSGGSTNLWMATKNAPPAGMPSGSSNSTSQIKNLSHSANLDYRPSLQSYADAGVPLTATINAVMPLCSDGLDSTKMVSGAIWIDSNPAQAVGGYSFDFGNGSGVVGAFPQGWATHAGSVTTNSYVNVNTSPIVVIRKVSSGPGGADVDLIGVYADYR